ncbi:carboxypeptidase-like regulatory domain-containing protein [uncultured Dokdonia sp.]|uniref:carboxypeptidase-like regulatory domain-containing protein n=1 Tax=uncultured Dokdonia sp. TaxID=575653 RepID=UPI002631DEF8|nr:carboxypeptidase-like regulatory domain-containing protein [uncultured Dokdonia sp.]
MTTLIKYIITVLTGLLVSGLTAQTVSARLIDSKTQEPIPFATIELSENQGVISNEDGIFTINLDQLKKIKDSVYISSMGYERKGIWMSSLTDSVVRLSPKSFELKGVFLSSNPLSAEEVIEKVKENMDKNYYVQELSKKKIFFRQSDFNTMKKVDFGFKKSTIEELNKELIDSIATLVPRESSYYREVVGDFYGNYNKHKFHVDKAAELYDKSKDVSVDGLSERLETIFKENVKPDSYLKIKSGLFGTKVQLDSITAANEDANKVKVEVENTDDQNFQEQIKNRISELYTQLFFNEDSKIDILTKSNRYEFEIRDYTFIDEEPVYIIDFSPKGKKDFKGTAFVNISDFAIVRLEFANVRPLFKFGLLGIKYGEDVYRGKMLFTKNTSGSYSPRYLELENGNYFGVDRPLKVIEKNKHVKGRRKQNELSLALDVQGTSLSKYEMVVFNSEDISSTAYEAAPENKNVKATYLSKYDPAFWSGYTIMEPNAAIQAFEVVE